MTTCPSDVSDDAPTQPSRTTFRKKPPAVPKPPWNERSREACQTEETGPDGEREPGGPESRQLDGSQVADCTESTEPEASSGSYKSSWQRWQCMPKFLEQQRQLLLEKPLQERTSKPPSKEALDFFESLLAGTEPTPSTSTSSATATGAAQVQCAARRLQRQAEAARRRRQDTDPHDSHDPVQKPAVTAVAEDAAEGPADRHSGPDVPKDSEGPLGGERAGARNSEPREGSETFEHREFLRRLEHQRKLQELQVEAERERRELLAQIEQEQAEMEARRNAQEEWREDLARKTQKKKEEAERDAWSRTRSRDSDNYWRTRWFRYIPKAEPQGPKGPKWNPRPPHFSHGPDRTPRSPRNEPETGSEKRSQRRRPCAAPPPISWPASAEGAQLLQELLNHRDEPLESRKRTWRWPQIPTDGSALLILSSGIARACPFML